MENIIELIKKHKIKLLILLVVIFFFKSCGGSRDLRNLDNKHKIELDEIKKNNELEKKHIKRDKLMRLMLSLMTFQKLIDHLC